MGSWHSFGTGQSGAPVTTPLSWVAGGSRVSLRPFRSRWSRHAFRTRWAFHQHTRLHHCRFSLLALQTSQCHSVRVNLGLDSLSRPHLGRGLLVIVLVAVVVIVVAGLSGAQLLHCHLLRRHPPLTRSHLPTGLRLLSLYHLTLDDLRELTGDGHFCPFLPLCVGLIVNLLFIEGRVGEVLPMWSRLARPHLHLLWSWRVKLVAILKVFVIFIIIILRGAGLLVLGSLWDGIVTVWAVVLAIVVSCPRIRGDQQLLDVTLKDLVIQNPGSKQHDALGVHHWFVATRQALGHYLLAIHDHGHLLLLHADGNSVPPAIGEVDSAEDGVLLRCGLAVLVLVEKYRRAAQLHSHLLQALFTVHTQQEGLNSSTGLHQRHDGEVLRETRIWEQLLGGCGDLGLLGYPVGHIWGGGGLPLGAEACSFLYSYGEGVKVQCSQNIHRVGWGCAGRVVQDYCQR